MINNSYLQRGIEHFLIEHGYKIVMQGKEKHSGCPYCKAGKDRFFFYFNSKRNKETFHCRCCNRSGDIVNLLMDIDGYTYKEAFAAIGKNRVESKKNYIQSSSAKLNPSERSLAELKLVSMLFQKPKYIKSVKDKLDKIKEQSYVSCIKFMLWNGSASDPQTMVDWIEKNGLPNNLSTDDLHTIRWNWSKENDGDEESVLRKLGF